MQTAVNKVNSGVAAKVTNVKFVGIGGLGVLKASLIFAEVVFKAGYCVKKAEVHGMSQRGGSISSDVRFGSEVFSPMIPNGEVDYLVAVQDDQKSLYEWECNDHTVVLTSAQLDLSQIPNKKAVNIAMLGLLSGYLSIPLEVWLPVIQKTFKPAFYEANKAAFEYGRSVWKA